MFSYLMAGAFRCLHDCIWTICGIVFSLLVLSPVWAQNAAPKPDKTELQFFLYRIEVEVASTEPARARGLMGRRGLGENEGMLFVFPTSDRHCMWMKDTRIPLSVAFVDDAGRITNIEDMKPRTLTPHCATVPARFAVEVNQGWFARRGLKAGERMQLSRPLPGRPSAGGRR